jgi:osmotically-inducible protein OsmY
MVALFGILAASTETSGEEEMHMDDKQLRRDVLSELDCEPSIESANIGVTVDHGLVTLLGHVPNFAQKQGAENVVKRIHGVRGVVQDIEVRPPADAMRADDEIAKRALSVLEWDITIPHDAIQLRIENGWITLSGEVDWDYQRSAADYAIGRLNGVLGVRNLIRLKPQPQAADIKHSIAKALERSARLEANGISVSVSNDKVILEGRVPTWHDRKILEDAVWAARGVKTLEDRVTVG